MNFAQLLLLLAVSWGIAAAQTATPGCVGVVITQDLPGDRPRKHAPR